MLSIQHSRLSQRGLANVEKIWPRISSAVAERENNSNPVIDLGTSENWLIRNELLQIYKRAVAGNFSDRHLSYPDGFAGDVELLKALASFFNSYFKPHIPVEVEHIATAPGAAFALDALLYNICEPGDAVLVPGPFWNGFDWLLNVKASVQPVLVNVDTFENIFTTQLIPSLEKAFSESTYPIKGLLFTNPHNPFGRCYPESVIKECIKFCNAKNIHFISDELYALSAFESQDQPTPEPFVSVLQLDIEALGCDQSRVHVIWSTSKDFGSSGLRMGCCITQANRPLAVGLALASNTQMSSLTAIATTALLTSPELPGLIKLNSERLGKAYSRMVSFFKQRGIEYMPANIGPYVFAKLAPDAQSWEDEARVVSLCKEAGVSVSSGRSYHVIDAEKGWARITFAVDQDRLNEGLRRLEAALS